MAAIAFTPDEVAAFAWRAHRSGLTLGKAADCLGWDCLDGLAVLFVPGGAWHIVDLSEGDGAAFDSIASGHWDEIRRVCF